MGLLAPGILKVGDIPQLAALIAPRRLVIADGVTSQARKLSEKYLRDAFSFTVDRFKLYKAETRLTLSEGLRVEDIVATLGI